MLCWPLPSHGGIREHQREFDCYHQNKLCGTVPVWWSHRRRISGESKTRAIKRTDFGLSTLHHFCLCENEEVVASLCPQSRYLLCGVQVQVLDIQPFDCITLYNDSNCSSHFLACSKTVFFGSLLPDSYNLLIRRGDQMMGIYLRLPPGCNVILQISVEKQQGRWYRDPFHYFFNDLTTTI